MAVGQSGVPVDDQKFSSAYSPALVMAVLQKAGSRVGLDLVSRALQLYYLARSPDIPAWAKASIFAALGYLVVTPDAVPDITPVLGFVDDLAVLTSALAGVSAYISPEIRAKVLLRMQTWFGSDVAMPEEKFPIKKT